MKRKNFFQFKLRRGRAGKVSRTDRLRPEAAGDEGFVGEIQGYKASDIEERFARALDKRRLGYDFRTVYNGRRNQTGSVELDFEVVEAGLMYPFQIDGQFAHKSGAQRDEDRMKDAILDDILRGRASAPVQRVAGHLLETQAEAEAAVREYFQ